MKKKKINPQQFLKEIKLSALVSLIVFSLLLFLCSILLIHLFTLPHSAAPSRAFAHCFPSIAFAFLRGIASIFVFLICARAEGHSGSEVVAAAAAVADSCVLPEAAVTTCHLPHAAAVAATVAASDRLEAKAAQQQQHVAGSAGWRQ